MSDIAFLHSMIFSEPDPRHHKTKNSPSICIISGKIEISHHDFRGGLFNMQKPKKSPARGGAKNYSASNVSISFRCSFVHS